MKVERTCEECGIAFLAWPSRIRSGRARFCSSSCASRARATRLNSDPEMVAKIRQGQTTTPKTGHKIKWNCPICNKEFWQFPPQKRSVSKLRFCCRSHAAIYVRAKSKTADVERTIKKRTEPGMNVVYDPIKQELRNE